MPKVKLITVIIIIVFAITSITVPGYALEDCLRPMATGTGQPGGVADETTIRTGPFALFSTLCLTVLAYLAGIGIGSGEEGGFAEQYLDFSPGISLQPPPLYNEREPGADIYMDDDLVRVSYTGDGSTPNADHPLLSRADYWQISLGAVGLNLGDLLYPVMRKSPFLSGEVGFEDDDLFSVLSYRGALNMAFLRLQTETLETPRGFFHHEQREYASPMLSGYGDIGLPMTLTDNLTAGIYAGMHLWGVLEPMHGEGGISIGGNVVYYPRPGLRLRGFADKHFPFVFDDLFGQDLVIQSNGIMAGADISLLSQHDALVLSGRYDDNGLRRRGDLGLGYVGSRGSAAFGPFATAPSVGMVSRQYGVGGQFYLGLTRHLELSLDLEYAQSSYAHGQSENDFSVSLSLANRTGLNIDRRGKRDIPVRAQMAGTWQSQPDASFDQEDYYRTYYEYRLGRYKDDLRLKELLGESPTLDAFVQNLATKSLDSRQFMAFCGRIFNSAGRRNHLGDDYQALTDTGDLVGNTEDVFQAIRLTFLDGVPRKVTVCSGIAQLYAHVLNRVSAIRGFGMRARSVSVATSDSSHVIVAIETKDGIFLADYGELVPTMMHNLEDAVRVYQANEGQIAIAHSVFGEDGGKYIGKFYSHEGKAIRRAMTVFGDREPRQIHYENQLKQTEAEQRQFDLPKTPVFQRILHRLRGRKGPDKQEQGQTTHSFPGASKQPVSATQQVTLSINCSS
ncbi:MAG: hypothetical protein HQ558_06790 [Candidatus Omnitrophica bacterium]|nr:hypothetical protein [Candidatus Omnitrophota bacterium]